MARISAAMSQPLGCLDATWKLEERRRVRGCCGCAVEGVNRRWVIVESEGRMRRRSEAQRWSGEKAEGRHRE